MALLGLGLQQWLSKGPTTGLAYISSQVGNKEIVILISTRAYTTVLRNCCGFFPFNELRILV